MGTVLLKSGVLIIRRVLRYSGAAFSGDATAYVYYHDRLIWVKPGESVEWIEA